MAGKIRIDNSWWFVRASSLFKVGTLVLMGSCPVSWASTLETEDVIVVRRENSTETTRRKGTIREWKGGTLTLFSSGREREIDNEDILDFQTHWSADYTAGLNSIKTGDMASAIKQLQSALANESRSWARRIMRADLVRTYTAVDNHLAAVQQFLMIIREDPQTRFFHLCPLQWVTGGQAIGPEAQQWLKSRDLVPQLIGASWLLMAGERDQATKVLDKLSRDIDANIKYLAIAQLWRLRALNLRTINSRQIEVWESLIDAMPKELRAGPWYVIAETQLRKQQNEAAITNLLRIPILYPQQLGLSAAAFYQAGSLLHNDGKLAEAEIVWNELKQKFPNSVWAGQVKSVLPANGANKKTVPSRQN